MASLLAISKDQLSGLKDQLSGLKDHLSGLKVLFPGDQEYERSVATANRLYRYMTPFCVIKATKISHIQAAVMLARGLKTRITVKNGGHSFAGFSNCDDDGILLDMSEFRKTEIEFPDKEKKIPGSVTLQAGALWVDAYRLLIEKKKDQYIIVGGRCPSVGTTGFTLGGGLSPFSRSYGMAIDQVQEITLVTAEGHLETVHATDKSDSPKGKLFWALRGSGGGNYGIVVETKHQLQELRDTKDGFVTVGKFIRNARELQPDCGQQDHDTIPKFIDTILKGFFCAGWSNETTIDTYWTCDFSQPETLPLQVQFFLYYNGKKKPFCEEINKHLADSPLKCDFLKNTLEEPSTRFLHETLREQWKDDQRRFCPNNPAFNLHSSFIFSKDDNHNLDLAIKALGELFSSFYTNRKFRYSKSFFEVKVIHGGGFASSIDSTATAFPWRAGLFFCHINVRWTDKFLEPDVCEFFDECKKKLMQFSIDKQAVFINFNDRNLENWQKAYYGGNYGKLQEAKAIWDPTDFCKFEQSIELPAEELAEVIAKTEDLGIQEKDKKDHNGFHSLAGINKRWERYSVPEKSFSELVQEKGHSCANCSDR